MKNKGFTIVELLAVIVILGLIIAITVPAITKTSYALKKRTYDTKISLIESSAVLYGEEHYAAIVKDGSTQDDNGAKYHTTTIKVSDLVPDYLTADDNAGHVENPIAGYDNNSDYLNEIEIIISINSATRIVTAKVNNPAVSEE